MEAETRRNIRRNWPRMRMPVFMLAFGTFLLILGSGVDASVWIVGAVLLSELRIPYREGRR